jgi:hypothetical protein
MDGKLPPPNPNLPYREDCWSEGETAALVDAWGSRYLDLNRGSLRQPQWREVADAVNTRPGASARRRPPRTDIQCKNRVDTLKKKYKSERARGASTASSPWLFYRQLDVLVGPTLSALSSKKHPSPPPRGGISMLRRRPSSPSRSPSPPSPAPHAALPIPKFHRGSNLPHADAFNHHHAAAAAAAAAADSDSDDAYNNNNYDDEDVSQQSASRSVSSHSGGDAPPPLGGKRKRGSAAGGFGELAVAMETFAEMYERMEAAKQRHAEEMEKQRIKFLKDLELKRMQAFVDMQLQLSRVKHAKNGASEMLMSLAALPFLSNPAYL